MQAQTEPTPRTCNACNGPCVPDGCAAGYATTQDGRTLCYPCADAAQRRDMQTADRWTAYIRTEPRPDGGSPCQPRTRYIPTAITTWTGGILATIRYSDWTKSAPFYLYGRTRCTLYSGTARTEDGTFWRWTYHDTGNSEIVRMRRVKN